MTSIFSSSWMCRLCGREACHECFEQVKELTTDRPGATEAEQAALQVRREKHAHINPFFLSCTRRNEHRAMDFSPMTRFSKDELQQTIADMEVLLGKKQPQTATTVDASVSNESTSANSVSVSEHGSMNYQHQIPKSSIAHASDSSIPPPGSPAKPTSPRKDSTIPPQSSSFATPVLDPSSQPSLTSPHIPALTPRYFTDAELTDDVFREVWKVGEPLVVTDLLKKFTLQWTPEYFKTKYGSQNCLILECQSDVNKRITVGEFFSLFGQYEGRRDCWKLKVSSTRVSIHHEAGYNWTLQDWPPSTDFKTAFPELYEDFASATPVPNYVRRDGVLNVASHFPNNAIAPDLGWFFQ